MTHKTLRILDIHNLYYFHKIIIINIYMIKLNYYYFFFFFEQRF